MNEIPDFESALASFQRFLAQEGHPSKILWVFREDIWQRGIDDVVLRVPAQLENFELAKKVFDEGRNKGLVDVHAIATVGDRVAATVWFPKFPGEEVQGWTRGMKLSIADPLPRAQAVGGLRWLCFRLHSPFRHYQRFESLVGTKPWAAAERKQYS
jgi:hypothetical protein